MRTTAVDPYGLFHLSLNKLPSEDPKLPPLTEWLNMGYWKEAKTFPEACKALALKTIAAAGFKEGDRVLDVGHGTGESLLLWMSDLTIPRPSLIVGVTSLNVHYQRSAERTRRRQLEQNSNIKVTLYHGDAVYHNSSGVEHPLCPFSGIEFDVILALDCAYHFHTRRSFLEDSFTKLTSGGRISLADISFSSDKLRTHRTKLLTSVLKLMPKENLISVDDYILQMKEIGYINVTIDDITTHVFPGFASFLKNRNWGWYMFGWIVDWYAASGAKFVIISGQKPKLK